MSLLCAGKSVRPQRGPCHLRHFLGVPNLVENDRVFVRECFFPSERWNVVTYKTVVLSPTGWTTANGIEKQVQEKLDAYSKAGWRLNSLTNVTGIGAVLGGSIGPYLVLVFVSG